MSKNPALLIVDVQEFLIEHAFEGHALVERIEKLITRARDLQIPVFYIQHCESEGEFEIGTPTWQIHHAITPKEHEPVIQKFACDSFFDTPLRDELGSREINHLFIVGLQTEYCIDTTSRRAISLGYDVTLVEDCHSTLDSHVLKAEQIIAHHNSVLNGFGTANNQIAVMSSDTLFV
ncbi:cysteine hydrolase family protein [Brevibacillus choshinensis]|uniref:cysteine hydrolase family protein n=1 Tax=Brevibacillus choshinensis TaxID=54911 RepID=UPI002E1FFB0C|nr:cysteine hydrolase family protein [Brevibacillus choshinensis]MED4752223.1 cysteine hydrolase family protein [Brevibacillus choshinensis]